jgi:hypothetical protein
MPPSQPRLRDPERAKLLRELADNPIGVGWLLRAERHYKSQLLDDDVRAGKKILTLVSFGAAINVTLSLFWPLLGALGSFSGSILILGRMTYERLRPQPQTDRPTVERSLSLLGGAGSLPVSFLVLAENRQVPARPFLVRDHEENEYFIAEKVLAACAKYVTAHQLTETEKEIYALLKKDAFSGSLDELIEASRNLAC